MSKTAFIFPGQGSQKVGMAKDLYDQFDLARKYFDTANSVLGRDLAGICFSGPEEVLKDTLNAQPALFVHSAIITALLSEKGLKADGVAGHSLGELSALAYANAYSFEEGIRLVSERGSMMKQAADHNPGSMAAIIGLNAESVISICDQAQSAGNVQVANFNSPQQIVISGSREGILKAMELAKAEGAKRALELPVSGAFHSPYMEEAADAFETALSHVQWQNLQVPVYANVTGSAVSEISETPSLLKKQLTNPVRWVETIQNMMSDGYSRFIEVGSGNVLTGLLKRISPDVTVLSCGTVSDLDSFKTL